MRGRMSQSDTEMGRHYDDDVTSGSSWSIAYEMHLLQRIPIYVFFLKAIYKTLLISASTIKVPKDTKR